MSNVQLRRKLFQHCSKEEKKVSKAECLYECEESQMLNIAVSFHSKNHFVRPLKYAEEFWLRQANVGNKKNWSFLFPMHAFPTSPNPKSNFNAKKSGKLDGNTLSPMDILCSMTLLGNVQSLFSMVWPLLNFSWLGKAAYRLGVHWKKHIWGYISGKGLQKERRSEILYLVSHTSGKHVKALWSHECLFGVSLSCVLWWSLQRIHVVGKEQNGKGFVLCVGRTGSVQQQSGKLWYTSKGTPISLPGWLAGLCRQHRLVLSLSHPGKANCMRLLKDFLNF